MDSNNNPTQFHQQQGDGNHSQPSWASTPTTHTYPTPYYSTSGNYFCCDADSTPCTPTSDPNTTFDSFPPQSDAWEIHPSLRTAINSMVTQAQTMTQTKFEQIHGLISTLEYADIDSANTLLLNPITGDPVLANEEKAMAMKFAFVEWLWSMVKDEGVGREELLNMLVFAGEVALSTWSGITGQRLLYETPADEDCEERCNARAAG